MPTADDVLARLGRTTDQIIGWDDLLATLRSGRQLRIKFGVDCTAPDLHLGHAVNLWMMRYLQDLGHVVVFLLGDTTTRIGDPTGRSTVRPVISPEEIERNASAFLDQVNIVLRTEPECLEKQFLAVFSDGGLPDDVPSLSLPAGVVTVLDLVLTARPDLTRSAARRLIAGGGVRLDESALRDPQEAVHVGDGAVLRAGRRRWFRLVRSE